MICLTTQRTQSKPAALRALCNLASSAYARASRSVASGSFGSMGIMYSFAGSRPESSSWSGAGPTRWCSAPGYSPVASMLPVERREEKPSPVRRRLKRERRVDVPEDAGGDVAGAGMDEGAEDRIPLSHRFTRQKLSNEVNRMNHPRSTLR